MSSDPHPIVWTSRWKELKAEFDAKFTEFMQVVTKCDLPDQDDTVAYLRELIKHNMSDGKRIRGTLVPAVVEACAANSPDAKLSSPAHMTGWCIEMIHAGFLILDDIMDDSHLRRGRPTWLEIQLDAGLGLLAINDGVQLVLTAKHLLCEIFTAGEDCSLLQAFWKVSKLFDEVGHQTGWGQNLDARYSKLNRNTKDGIIDLSTFTRARFNKIAQWKTGYYTFYLPVACGMAIAGVTDSTVWSETKNILLQLGQYFQAQDDYLDCFGDPSVTGKVGTDIADGKCTWLIAECVDRASPEQVDIIKHHYGRQEAASVKMVQEVYSSLNLPDHFKIYETEMHQDLMKRVRNLNPDSGLAHLLSFLIDLLFGRSR